MDLISHPSRNSSSLSWKGWLWDFLDAIGLDHRVVWLWKCALLQDKGRTTSKVIRRSSELPTSLIFSPSFQALYSLLCNILLWKWKGSDTVITINYTKALALHIHQASFYGLHGKGPLITAHSTVLLFLSFPAARSYIIPCPSWLSPGYSGKGGASLVDQQ